MALGYQKIEEMIDEEVAKVDHLSDESKLELARLCKKIYTAESSGSNLSNKALIDQITAEITATADSVFK
jgi:hypothetical protein